MFVFNCGNFCVFQFFYLVTETYTQGNMKEMRKWAYEIHSTFLVEKAVSLSTTTQTYIPPSTSFFFFFKFLEDTSPFRGAADTPILDFWWRLRWVSKLGWIPSLACPAHNGFLRFTSGATPADCIDLPVLHSHGNYPTEGQRITTCPVLLKFNLPNGQQNYCT